MATQRRVRCRDTGNRAMRWAEESINHITTDELAAILYKLRDTEPVRLAVLRLREKEKNEPSSL